MHWLGGKVAQWVAFRVGDNLSPFREKISLEELKTRKTQIFAFGNVLSMFVAERWGWKSLCGAFAAFLQGRHAKGLDCVHSCEKIK